MEFFNFAADHLYHLLIDQFWIHFLISIDEFLYPVKRDLAKLKIVFENFSLLLLLFIFTLAHLLLLRPQV